MVMGGDFRVRRLRWRIGISVYASPRRTAALAGDSDSAIAGANDDLCAMAAWSIS